ncbi:MAG: hypothetical protein AAFP84_07460 [Actinomycetota bacterium]
MSEINRAVVDELTRLRAQLDEVKAELRNLRGSRERSEPMARTSDRPEPDDASSNHAGGLDPTTSRRGAVKVAGAAVAGLAAAALAPAGRAAAADPNDVVKGETNSASGPTALQYSGSNIGGQNVFTASGDDFAPTSSFPSAIGGYGGYGGNVDNGVFAFAFGAPTSSSGGHALIAWPQSARSHMLLVPSQQSPREDAIAHRAGSIRVDNEANMWFCTEAGTPGTWRRVVGPDTAGALHAIDPVRVYDSRFSTPLATGTNRTIDVSDSIDPTTGAVVDTDVVPEGATAVAFNVTITATTGVGFLQVAPGGFSTSTASTINWSGAGVTIANGSISKLDAQRQLALLSGPVGAGTTEAIIDITGYTI